MEWASSMLCTCASGLQWLPSSAVLKQGLKFFDPPSMKRLPLYSPPWIWEGLWLPRKKGGCTCVTSSWRPEMPRKKSLFLWPPCWRGHLRVLWWTVPRSPAFLTSLHGHQTWEWASLDSPNPSPAPWSLSDLQQHCKQQANPPESLNYPGSYLNTSFSMKSFQVGTVEVKTVSSSNLFKSMPSWWDTMTLVVSHVFWGSLLPSNRIDKWNNPRRSHSLGSLLCSDMTCSFFCIC